MNIFVLDKDPYEAAKLHCDLHVIKMILESAQMLSTACRINGLDFGYKKTHVNHPCTKWVLESKQNWLWLYSLANKLNDEYMYRWCKTVPHKSMTVINGLPTPSLPDIGLTPFAIVVPDKYLVKNDPVLSYRNYYIGDKAKIARWKLRNTPEWFKPHNNKGVETECKKALLVS